MQSIFDAEVNNNFLERIARLSPTSSAQWGKMNVSQMLAHCTEPIRGAFGETKLKRSFLGKLVGSFAKRRLTSNDKPFDRNMPTDPRFIIKTTPEFESQKQVLLELVARFASQGKQALTKDEHPFFGRMTHEEWDVLMYKHLDHHLRQFGV